MRELITRLAYLSAADAELGAGTKSGAEPEEQTDDVDVDVTGRKTREDAALAEDAALDAGGDTSFGVAAPANPDIIYRRGDTEILYSLSG